MSDGHTKARLLGCSVCLVALACEPARGEVASSEAGGASATANAAAPAVAVPASASVAAYGGETQATAAPAVPEGMAVIPEGTFVMGGESKENTPLYQRDVARFYLDLTEVTVDAYASCVKSGPCKPMQKNNPFCNIHFEGRGKHPVNCVDWNDADGYCKSVGKRLPSEREWEFAARAGAEQRLYAWGAEEPDATLACYMHQGGTCEVATHPAAGFGLFDMTGNVWEWNSSSFTGPYTPVEPEGPIKLNRGGSWSRRFSKWMRNDLRNRYRVDEQNASLGFRCAKNFEPLTCPKDSEPLCVRPGEPLASVASASARPVLGPGALHPSTDGRALTAPSASVASTENASAAPENETPVRGRSPKFDADCARFYPGLPVAYAWSGGTFQSREPLIRSAGCKKRDVGLGWSSACCAQ